MIMNNIPNSGLESAAKPRKIFEVMVSILILWVMPVTLCWTCATMTEPIRNMLGFVLVPMTIGVAAIVCVCLVRRSIPSFGDAFGLLGGLVLLGLLSFASYLVAWFFELPCGYYFTVVRMPSAISVNGVPVSKIINGDDVHWVTDGYIAGICGEHG
jgi:hypothetical protein